MKLALFSASLLAAASIATSASAEFVGKASDPFDTPEEATSNAPELPDGCVNPAGENRCMLTIWVSEGPDMPRWRALWATSDSETACVDRATADRRVACDAADAVRILVVTSGGLYPSPHEALRNAPLPPVACLDAEGTNICYPRYLDYDGPQKVQWSLTWALPELEFARVDEATADTIVACDAPDAVRVTPRIKLTVPMPCPRNADGTPGDCPIPEPAIRMTPMRRE